MDGRGEAMRGRRPRTDLGFRATETPVLDRRGAGGPILLYVLMAVAVVALALVSAVRPEPPGSGSASADAVLMTLGDDGRPASWDAFFERHPLPDDAIRERILASNEGAPADVVCVPLDAAAAETACQ